MQKLSVIQGNRRKELSGLLSGLLAIACFSVTLPATRVAVSELDSAFVGLGRSLLAAIPAVLLLYGLKIPFPVRAHWRGIFIVMLGVVLGFPLLTSLAMQNVSGAQGAIVVSILPLFTAIAGALLFRQMPSAGFWLMAVTGSGVVLVFLMWGHQGGLQKGELILLAASVLCAFGYAQGGKLAIEMGGVAVISWAIILSVPFTLIAVIYRFKNLPVDFSATFFISLNHWQAWAGFLYVGFISQWLAFVFWYKGLALGGVIRVSQLQLIQPFLTLIVSAVWLGESITWLMMVVAVVVFITVMTGRKMAVYK